MSKIHLFDHEHFRKFPNDSKERWNATKCGYIRENVTCDIEKVTCKLCLRVINKTNSKNSNDKLKFWLENL